MFKALESFSFREGKEIERGNFLVFPGVPVRMIRETLRIANIPEKCLENCFRLETKEFHPDELWKETKLFF